MEIKNTRLSKFRRFGVTGILSIIGLGLCSFNVDEVNRTSDLNLKGNVKNVRHYHHEVKDIFGSPKKDGKMEYPKWFFLFNKEGNIIERNSYEKSGKLIERNVFQYDAKHDREAAAEYDPNGLMAHYYTFYYDANKLKKVESKYDKNGEFAFRILYEYDEHNRLSTENGYTPNAQLSYQNTYTYDDNSIAVQKTFYNNNGEIKAVEINNFDKQGHKIGERKNTYKNGQAVLDYIIAYNYDKNGNITEEVKYNSAGKIEYRKAFVYEFDKKGNWIKKTQLVTGIDIPTIVEERLIDYF